MTTTAPSTSRRTVLLPVVAVAGLVAVAVIAAIVASLGGSDREVSVFPGSTTLAAHPDTGITLRGIGGDGVGDVAVTGSRSGPHTGSWREHPDGNGAAFTPDEPFEYGERVTVDVGMNVAGADGESSSFVVTQRNTAPEPPDDKAKPPVDQGVRTFASRPDLHPPAVRVEQSSPAAARGRVFVAPKRGATQMGPLILDDAGEPIWFHPLSGNDQAFDFRAQRYRGRPVLTWWQGRMQLYRGGGVGRILDNRYRPVATVRAGNGYEMDAHEMKLTPAGTALTMSYFVVPWDLSKLGGRRDGLVEDNVVQEIDVETGAVLFEWHTLGSIPLGESYRPAPKEQGKIHDPWHLNSVELDRDGDFVVSARHANALYKVDRETGEVVWRLGGKESDFEMGRGTVFKLQHDARLHPDGTLSVFDNVSEDVKSDEHSRGLVLRPDEDEMSVSLVKQFEHPDELLSATQGSMQVHDGGGAFVGWGGLHPEFSEFDADGGLVFDARFMAKGVETYRAYRMPWRARGEGRPAAVASDRGGATVVRASWNGSTQVARWRVRPEGAVKAPVTAARTGFETTIRVPGSPASVVVEALGARGRVLAKTEAVPVR